MTAEGTKEKEKGEAEPLATTKGAAEQLLIQMQRGVVGEKQFWEFAKKEHAEIITRLQKLNKANYRTKEGKLLVNSVNRRNVMLATVVVTAHKMFTFSGNTAIKLKIALETTNENITAKVKELDMRLQEVEVEALDNPLMEKHLAGHAGVIDEMYKIHEKYHKSRQTKKYMPGRILFGRMLERATPALLALQAERKGKGPLEAEKREENVVTVVEPQEEKKEEQTKAPGEKKVTDLEKGKRYVVSERSDAETAQIKGLLDKILDEKTSTEAAKEFYAKHLDEAIRLFEKEPTVLDVEVHGDKTIIVGDLHGDVGALRKLFANYPPDKYTYLLMGDNVDRSWQSAELLAALLASKMLHPEKFLMLRGDHESPIGTLTPQQFPVEIIDKYKEDKDAGSALQTKIYEELFPKLPLAAVVDKRFFVVHGGIPIDAPALTELESLKKVVDPASDKEIQQMLWNDPMKEKGSARNQRGKGVYSYGPDIVDAFLSKNKLDMIIRGHEHGLGGYSMDGKVLTLLTTSAYGEGQYIGVLSNTGLYVVDVSGQVPATVMSPVSKR